MQTDLLVAIFDYTSLAEGTLQNAVHANHKFANCLRTISIFDRTPGTTIEARMLQLNRGNKIENVSKGVLDEELLKRALPQRAQWKVIETAYGEQIPETSMNGDFVTFLEFMMMPRTSSVFYIPEANEDANHFLENAKQTAGVILHTSMTEDKLNALRATLKSTRLH